MPVFVHPPPRPARRLFRVGALLDGEHRYPEWARERAGDSRYRQRASATPAGLKRRVANPSLVSLCATWTAPPPSANHPPRPTPPTLRHETAGFGGHRRARVRVGEADHVINSHSPLPSSFLSLFSVWEISCDIIAPIDQPVGGF